MNKLAILFAGLMALTRGFHYSSSISLPSSSWVVFMLVGAFLSPRYFIAFILLSIGIDVYVIGVEGVSAYCISAAYPILQIAHGSMWLAGYFYKKHNEEKLRLMVYALVGTVVCELISSGSFYLLAPYFTPNISEFLNRESVYMTEAIFNTGFWIILTLITIIIKEQVEKISIHRDSYY